MAKTVKRAVFVKDNEGHEKWFYPGDKLPGWAEDAISNPLVFKDIDDKGVDMLTVEGDEDEEPEFEGDLMDLTHEELDRQLEERNLSTSGAKKDKVARIEAYDASQS